MRSTPANDRCSASALLLMLATAGATTEGASTQISIEAVTMTHESNPPGSLTVAQQAIVPIAAFAAAGDMKKLGDAIGQALDAGLTVSDIREVLVQLYAYAGFPRSLNALGEMMTVLESRKQRGIEDAPGRAPSRDIPTGDALMKAGTGNQTKLAGAPVKAPVFEFAPAIDAYLKTHLFGDIFERDNLDWQSREVATVAMLAAMSGTGSQLKSHMRISRNVGLKTSQLRQLADVLTARVDPETGSRARDALERSEAAR